ncbi:MAG: hypothetical protein Q7S52_06045 [bacterium]|nr:hypothetical protein [bacterium]
MNRFLYPTLLILLAMALYLLYTKPLYIELHGQLAKEAEVKAALVEADKAQEQLDEIRKRYESFPSDANERLNQLLPERIDPIRLLIDSTAFLERNGFSAESLVITTDDGTDNDVAPYRTHTISFPISASYDTFREFLRLLEQSLVLRDTSSVSFTTAVETTGARVARPELLIHNYNLQIIGYSLR